ncbi:hypothetical protein A9Q87_04545 [Flavobacteriales bacterium 34_180_T64]|nr:hypothetical protein A9Q87_04545 [Flavobacteriales bacterium 34_180_T64]
MTLDEIYRKENISVRSYHVCKYNNLNSVIDLKEYYYKFKSFEKLRNCGRKSNEELIEICNNYQSNGFESEKFKTEYQNPLIKIIIGLTRVQRDVINSFILINTNRLSVRSKNAISLYLEGNLKLKNFTEKISLSDSFAIKNIKNIGIKCIPELENYISNINDFLIEVNESNDEKHLISLRNNFLIQQTFSVSQIPNKILESESIFLVTDFLLNKNILFDETQTTIVKKALKIFKNSPELTLDNIAVVVNLSRERVRQKKVNCLDNLLNKLLFLQNFNDDLFQKYGIDTNSDQIDINSNVVDVINNTNNTNLSREFITYILFAYLCDSFSLVGNIEDVIQPKHFNARKRHNWKHFYLIKKNIDTEIDINALANDISSRISDRIEESYSFNFKSYLSRFLTKNNIEILDLAFPIGEKIVNDEFEIYLDLEENIIFKRNTNKQAYEYAYEALEQLGKPSKVKEIFEKVLELHPNYDTEEAKIRVSMKRKDGFVPIGRKSVFALKKWEDELDNFKGGTIRDIVEEYLTQFKTPKHISDITNHVLKYRPKSNQSSILQNLKLDESGLYMFFKGSHIGLSTKKYENDFIKLSKVIRTEIKTWEERFDDLINFIAQENRLPYSAGCPEDEIKLYRWLNIQKGKISKGKLESKKEKIISEINNKYPKTNGKRSVDSSEKYTELIAFVMTNFRLPSSIKKGEENLYRFFYKKRNLFNRNELESEEEIKFIEVAKLLQNIKNENKRN